MTEQTGTIAAPPFPPPAAPPPTPRRRWYQQPVSRDPDDHKVGGVIAGLSRTYGFDVRTTRIAVLIATIVLPVLIVLYIAAWLLLPARPSEATSLEHIVRDRRRVPLYIAIALVLVAGGVGSFGSWFFLGGLPWGFGLVAVGILLWIAPGLTRSPNSPTPPPPPGGPVTVPTTDVPTTDTSTTDQPTTVMPTADLPSSSNPVTTTSPSTLWTGSKPLQMDDIRPRRKRRPVASLVTLAVVAFIGVAAAGDSLDWWDIPVLTTVVVSLIATTVGAVVSAIVNRNWLSLPIVPLLAVVTTGLLITQPHLGGGIGDRTVRPHTVAAAERHQQLGIGELTIDLRDVPLGQPVDVRAVVGIGHLQITVPRDATVVIDSQIGAGDVVIDGMPTADGIRNSDQHTLQPVGANAGTINLDVEIGAGRIDIERAL